MERIECTYLAVSTTASFAGDFFFEPSHVSVKGWRAWETRQAEGITHQEARDWLKKARELCPRSVASHMGEPELRGMHLSQIIVPVSAGLNAFLCVQACLKDRIADRDCSSGVGPCCRH